MKDSLSYTKSWYRLTTRKILPSFGTPAYVAFISQAIELFYVASNERVHVHTFRVEDVDTPAIDKNKHVVILPKWYVSEKAFEKLVPGFSELDGESKTAASISIINGSIIHEALHVQFTKFTTLPEAFRSNPKYLEKYGNFILAIMNTLEDIHIEAKFQNEKLKRFVNMKNSFLFSKTEFDSRISKLENDPNKTTKLNLIITYKNQELRTLPFREYLDDQVVDILEEVAMGLSTVERRVELSYQICNLLEDEVEDGNESGSGDKNEGGSGDKNEGENEAEAESETEDGSEGESEDESEDEGEDESEGGSGSGSEGESEDENEGGSGSESESEDESEDESGSEGESEDESEGESEDENPEHFIGSSSAEAQAKKAAQGDKESAKLAKLLAKMANENTTEAFEKTSDTKKVAKQYIKKVLQYDITKYEHLANFPRFALFNTTINFSFLTKLRELRTRNRVPGEAKIRGPHLVNTRISRIATDGKIFANSSSTRDVQKNPEIVILVDGSGSMGTKAEGGLLIEHALSSAKQMHLSLRKAGIPNSVYLHTSTDRFRDQPILLHISSFGMKQSNSDTENRFEKATHVELKENYDGFMIEELHKNAFTNRIGEKIIIVISDGEPAGPGYICEEAIGHTKNEIEKARKAGRIIFCFSIVPSVERANNKIYGEAYNVASSNWKADFERVIQKLSTDVAK